jgi:hypothetical protein
MNMPGLALQRELFFWQCEIRKLSLWPLNSILDLTETWSEFKSLSNEWISSLLVLLTKRIFSQYLLYKIKHGILSINLFSKEYMNKSVYFAQNQKMFLYHKSGLCPGAGEEVELPYLYRQ